MMTKPKTKKLSYKHQYALESLPKEIDVISTDIKKLEAKLAEPELYSKNPDAFNQATRELEKLSGLLLEKEEAWLELELMREQTE